jgi:hypothetical protein
MDTSEEEIEGLKLVVKIAMDDLLSPLHMTTRLPQQRAEGGIMGWMQERTT